MQLIFDNLSTICNLCVHGKGHEISSVRDKSDAKETRGSFQKLLN